MMIRKIVCLSISALCLISFSVFSVAGQLYRFVDENGVLTLSRSLPPEAAQRGYDIVDDKSMRLIERVTPAPTADEIVELKKQQQREAEAKRQAEIAAQEAEKQRQKRAIYDHTLLTTYQNEAELIRARDTDLNYRKEQIAIHQEKLPKLEKYLLDLQKEAADKELSGGKISKNMQKRLDTTQQEIAVRQQAIEQLQSEIETLSDNYSRDLSRLRALLEARNNR
ncbi:DUF4124 domain-containing protein [Methylophaga sp. OBS4]|uniref:DUF4124 domain-containing protein n=1 Tax=Methylophaga sp. OBS4 TaxID=2991935 RepID=UPI0022571BB4|nr:DUF4124 domain-containing protein [Methylophaga sp. OBS4]MCX4187948.1 DUF4124 domain-containing protein [Methylophaga sp. OBS4]